MNLGGRRITNDDLCDAFAAIGYEGVGAFRASGNIAFDAGGASSGEAAARIEAGLAAELGYAVPTFVRTAAEMRALADAEPFDPGAIAASKGKLQVIFLREQPTRSRRAAVLARASDDDRLAFGAGAELFWLPAGGLLESGLGMDGLADLLGVCTHRTKGTVEQLTRRFFG